MIGIIVGSLRKDSFSSWIAQSVGDILTERGVEWELVNIDLPHYNPDVDEAGEVPASAQTYRDQVNAADALIVVSPEYNGSTPSAVKAAVDWGSRPYGEASLAGKPVLPLAASAGAFGGVWPQADMRKSFGIAGATVIGEELAIPKIHELRESGLPKDIVDGLTERIELLLTAVEQTDPANA